VNKGVKIGFAGQSHLGLISQLGLAIKGFEVVAYDPDKELIVDLLQKEWPIHEPSYKELMDKHTDNIAFSSDVNSLKVCDVVYVSMDVPTDSKGSSDLSVIEELVQDIAPVVENKILVILSQVKPGFTRKIHQCLNNVKVYYQVETLIFGRAMERTLEPERYIIGSVNKELTLDPQYQKILEPFACPILHMNYESAELAKISINLFLVSTVTTTNLIAEVCEGIGAEWGDIADCLRLDKRIGAHAYLSPGLGISGGNLERDMATIINLAEGSSSNHEIVDSWVNASKYMKEWPVRKFRELAADLGAGDKVAVLGLTYKPNTHSLKNSPSVELIKCLKAKKIEVYDPMASIIDSEIEELVQQVEEPMAACEGAAVVIVMTPWAEIKSLNIEDVRKVMKGNIIIDPLESIASTGVEGGGYFCRGRNYVNLETKL